jgi:gliding motility-associated protein GldC
MNPKVVKKSKIEVEIGFDEKKMPIEIKWKTSDAPPDYPMQEVKAFVLSLFDKPTKDTLKVDLWTTEMQVEEMDRFIFSTMRSLTDTYFRATGNKKLAEQMQQFVHHFGEETKIIPKK